LFEIFDDEFDDLYKFYISKGLGIRDYEVKVMNKVING